VNIQNNYTWDHEKLKKVSMMNDETCAKMDHVEKSKTEIEENSTKLETDVMEKILGKMTAEDRKSAMEKMKSAKSLAELLRQQNHEVTPKMEAELGKEIGLTARIKVMEEYCRKFPHLSMKKLNRMVAEGDIKNGIELKEEARVRDAAFYMAKGTKQRIHRKRSKTKGNDPGLGHRPPFFMIELDLIDLSNETKGNRWDYNWLMVALDKEYGTLKIYPLRGKDDVRDRWRQYKQWRRIISPYCEAKLGVKAEVGIVGNDRGSEFITTHGRTRGELDEELYQDNIYRWTPSAGDSNKLGKVEHMNRVIMENVNYMLRYAGAKNVWAYYAATMFEYHYNCTPTDGNKVGNGEAPFKTLGIPYDIDKFVRFMCPAYVRRPKHRDAETGATVNQTKLVEKMELCYIIGYGGPFSQGTDHDGYKVLIPTDKEDGEMEVYSSNDVFPVENCEITRSFLTGRAPTLLDENALIKRHFDVNREETLTGVNSSKNETGSNNEAKSKRVQKMTAGTGATGQMRYEMDGPKLGSKKDLMTKDTAKRKITRARLKNKLLVWKTPEGANKSGKSRERYEIYCKTRTVNEFEKLCVRRDQARKEDLNNDLRKGWVSIEPNPETGEADTSDEEENVDGHVNVIQGGGDVEGNNKFIFGMSSPTTAARRVKVNMSAINLVQDCMEDEFLLQVNTEAAKILGETQVPLWLALAVYHKAEVYVDSRKQPYTIQEAKLLKEWPEWKEAIMKEIGGLIAMGVWKEIPRSELQAGTKVLPGRMVLEIKTKDGKFDKCKARYVSRGDLSNRGEHYYESASHQMRSKSLKVFFALAATQYGSTGKKSWIPRNLDIGQAYLSRKRTEHEPEVYMELPTDTFGLCRDKSSGYVAKMLRHLYGEVDGGRAFERELLEFLESICGEATVSDRMVFKWNWNGHVMISLAHVDDIIYNGSDDAILDEFFDRAVKHFGKLTGGGPAEYLSLIHI